VDACDHTLLAALALGDASEEEARAAGRHLRHCAACCEELAALRDLVDTARTAPVDGGPVPPPARVWDAIAARIADESADGTAAEQRDGRQDDRQ